MRDWLQKAVKGCVNHKNSWRNCDPDSWSVYEHWKSTSLDWLFNDAPRHHHWCFLFRCNCHQVSSTHYRDTGSTHKVKDRLFHFFTLFSSYLVNTQSKKKKKKKKRMFLRCNHVSFPCCSNEFTDVVEIALKSCTVALVEEMETQPGLATGIQLAKLLPQIEKTVPEISAVPDKNRFLQLIRDLPQVHLFFTLLYSKPL